MWLDAFKPKSRNIQKCGVTSVTGVTRPANPINIRVDAYAARVTPVTPQKHNKPDNTDGTGSMLALFDMEAVQQEIDAGYPEDLLRRVNNIAWRLITTRGYPFNEAIKAAALWVADNPPHADEAAFVDVMALFKELGQ